MIYLKNNTETQAIYIPRQTVLGGGYIPSTKAYDNGYNDGLEVGKEQQKGKLSNLNVTANGQYEREDGWNVVTVDIPIEDCNLGEGNFSYTTSDVGRYELNASDDGYDGWSKIYLKIEGEGAIRVWRASELLDSFNNGETLDYGRNYYVGGQITEIREVNTQYGNATYFLDNGFQVFRGKWIDGNSFTDENQIKVGAYIVVYGVLNVYDRIRLELKKNSQVIAYQECTGGEIISCNLEDKSVTPSMSDRDSNNLIVVEESEGYDGLSRVVIDPQTIYNEGYAQGKTDGINEQKSKLETINITENGTYNREDGYNKIIVEVPDLNGSYDEGYAQGKTDGVNEQKSKLESINITKNGTYNREDGYNHIEVNVPTAQEQSFDYDITAFTYKVYDWTSVNINRNNMTNDCGDRPLDCLLFRNRSGECTVMTKFDTCSGTARLENGWNGDNIILSLKSNSITKFSSNSINSNRLTSIDTGFAQLEENAIMNCNALTDIKLAILNDNLSTQFATNCFNGLPAEGTITIGKNVDVTITLTDDEITSFFRTIVGEGWTIRIK